MWEGRAPVSRVLCRQGLSAVAVPAIYLSRRLPGGFSVPPSTKAQLSIGRRSSEPSGGLPSSGGIHELSAPGLHGSADSAADGGLLHRLLTLAPPARGQRGGCFLLQYPTVASSSYIRERDALSCPDFPPATTSGRGQRQSRSTAFPQRAKVGKNTSTFIFF